MKREYRRKVDDASTAMGRGFRLTKHMSPDITTKSENGVEIDLYHLSNPSETGKCRNEWEMIILHSNRHLETDDWDDVFVSRRS